MKPRTIPRRTVLGVGALAAGGLAAGAWLSRTLPVGENVAGRIDVGGIAGAAGFPGEGPATAAITMLVFSDYACGVCRQVEPWWRAAAERAGDVRVVHRDWPVLGPESVAAARLALAAAYQGRYVAVHNAFMRSAGLGPAALRAASDAAGADWRRLQEDGERHAPKIESLLARTAQDALRLGYPGTPGFLIGAIRVAGGASESQFAGAIDRARAALDNPQAS
jgi:protein-disulfide isomerase